MPVARKLPKSGTAIGQWLIHGTPLVARCILRSDVWVLAVRAHAFPRFQGAERGPRRPRRPTRGGAAAHREYGSGDAAPVDLTTRGHRRGRPMALTAHRASQPAQMELSRPLWATIDLRLRCWALDLMPPRNASAHSSVTASEDSRRCQPSANWSNSLLYSMRLKIEDPHFNGDSKKFQVASENDCKSVTFVGTSSYPGDFRHAGN